MIATWLAGKVSGLIIFVLACLAPVFLVLWIWEAVHLHGVVIPVPFIGHLELVHGAIPDRIAAEKARDLALQDLGVARTNEATLKAGLNSCNASIKKLQADGLAREAKAQTAVDAMLAQLKAYKDRVAALMKIRPTDEKCPVVDQIFTVGAGQ